MIYGGCKKYATTKPAEGRGGRRDKNGKDPILSIPLERPAENVKLRGAIVYREIGKSYLKLMIKPKILSVLTFQIQFGFWKIWDQPITCLIIS